MLGGLCDPDGAKNLFRVGRVVCARKRREREEDEHQQSRLYSADRPFTLRIIAAA
jgi:hypothetical protein